MNLIIALAVILYCAEITESKIYETVRRTTQTGQCRTIKYEQTVNIPGCVPKKIKMRMCGGACDSRITGQSTECSRCYPNTMKEAIAVLDCENGKKQKVKYLKLRNCQCRKVECKRWRPEERMGFTRIKFYI